MVQRSCWICRCASVGEHVDILAEIQQIESIDHDRRRGVLIKWKLRAQGMGMEITREFYQVEDNECIYHLKDRSGKARSWKILGGSSSQTR